ncbi:3-deoxy-D-manno-octulosonic acid transferase [SAR86 cluster bacterium]|jgi:3-deoxy-D-manno-octulosonic-acid transferase|nr:3-deoxy-D-manno-octulosonic acid transferase [SAR86 cluster bacterium]
MILFLYNFLIFLLAPFMVLRILFKSIWDKDYKLNISNRFGIYQTKNLDSCVWIHAVSLGEVIASRNIIIKLSQHHKITLSVSTPTGYREANKFFSASINIVYAPWDFLFFIKNFFKKFNPKALILFETEIWPTSIAYANNMKIPIFLANARMSKQSYKRYLKVPFLMSDTFKKFTFVFCQSTIQKERFINLGVKNQNIKVTGSVKFDLHDSLKENLKESSLKKYIIASSTHQGEERIIVEVYKELQFRFPELKLIIVPRHPERSKSILKILNKNNICSEIVSSYKNFNKNEVLIINATGMLNQLYKNAIAAFVGGSLVKRGGHNIIEPAANMCPFIVGPYMYNFEDVLNLFTESNACIQIDNKNKLLNAFKTLLNDSTLSDDIAKAAYKVVENNTGATKEQYRDILNLI